MKIIVSIFNKVGQVVGKFTDRPCNLDFYDRFVKDRYRIELVRCDRDMKDNPTYLIKFKKDEILSVKDILQKIENNESFSAILKQLEEISNV